jgi:DNA-binding CsgD family transcriptional regulator
VAAPASYRIGMTALRRTRHVELQAFRGYGTATRLRLRGRVLRSTGLARSRLGDSVLDNLRNMFHRFESDEVPGALVAFSLAGFIGAVGAIIHLRDPEAGRAAAGPTGILAVVFVVASLGLVWGMTDAKAQVVPEGATEVRPLDLAEHGEVRRSFLDAGAPARSLLARYRQRVPTSWSYLDELLQASAESARVTVLEPRLIEHLTEREHTVLRYLPSLMTYEEIASDLYVSLNTVKTHAYGIFRKLGVTGRRQAVRSARELHLL